MEEGRSSNVLLQVNDLKTYFFLERGVLKAVDGVTFQIREGQAVGIVGESGSGKTITAMSIMRLQPPTSKIVGGQILFRGDDLVQKKEDEIRAIRGASIAMVFQDPTSALNPAYTIGYQIAEAIQLHQKLSPAKAMERAIEILRLVGIPSPEERIHDFPHQISGGQRQRVMIAMALSCNPSLLIADEPTSNLDVTIQAQILELIEQLREKFGTALLMISHNLGVVAETCDQVAVMYCGEIVEYSDVESLFHDPKHPYTTALLKCVPRVDVQRQLSPIPGSIPNLISPPTGCKFHPRCPYAFQRCSDERPQLKEVAPGHMVACHLYS